MGTYSFKNIKGSLTGPGTSGIDIGVTSGAAKDGISVSMAEDKNRAETGAGGEIMHSLNASDTGTITIRLLKTSRMNAFISALYNFQKENPAAWGQNQIRFADTVRGDVVTGSEMAFVKQSDLGYATDGNTNEWAFVGRVYEQLGTGQPAVGQ